MIDFETAFTRLIGHEGAFTNNPDDDGNWTGGAKGRGELKGTKYGISAAAYPHLDIRNLTLTDARAIYRADYWDRVNTPSSAVRFQFFDAAVNHGHGNAIRMLQRAVDVADDGKWGAVSSTALWAADPNDVLLRFLGERLAFMASLKRFDEFGRGWSKRIAGNLKLAAQDN